MIDVGSVVDFGEGAPTSVIADGRELVVVKWRGSFYAVRNICPHQSHRFTGGAVHDGMFGTPGQIQLARDSPVLTCPVHRWKFSLRSGKCVVDQRMRVRAYPVSVANGRVFVDTTARGTTEREE
jgi:3-phenylpropionate/trans-cinnamate dioxygenase ferredoxin subunit